MPKHREVSGLADALALLVGPTLITTMIVALAFFLIEVFYGGEYSGRMRWTMFFFVLGSVLVARIAIEFGDARAGLYGLILGFVTFLAMQRFVQFPPGWMEQFGPLINIGLLSLTWWFARQLTWDCTHIDPERDASDRGVLEASGLGGVDRPEADPVQEAVEEEEFDDAENQGILARFQRWQEQRRKRPHTPGVWVVYFALAALPIFGLGQALIPVEDRSRRVFSFAMMVLYVGSAMGLLLTTAFLGLRRYLEQRNLRIPPRMAGLWLGIGSALIVAFLLVAALLPRPASETALIDVSSVIGSETRSASRYAMQAQGQGKGDGAAGKEASEQAQSDASVQGKSAEAGRGQGQDDARKGQGENKGQGGESGKSDRQGDSPGGSQPGEKSDENKSSSPPSRPGERQNADSRSESQGRPMASNSRAATPNRPAAASSRGPISIGQLGPVGRFVKWLVFAILAAVVVFFLLRRGLTILAQFSEWAKAVLNFWNTLWARLFGGPEPAQEDAPIEEFENVQPSSRPFADFRNPFDSEEAAKWPPARLVRQGFAALEAWAWEAGVGRESQETPLEFAQRIGETWRELQPAASRLAALYARLAYSRGPLPESSRDVVAEFWRRLESVGRPESRSVRATTEG